MKKPYVLVATAASALVLAGAVSVGVAAADPSTSPTTTAPTTTSPTTTAPTPGATSTPSAGPGATTRTPDQAKSQRKHRDLTRRALHGEVTLAGKKHRVVDVQRGTVVTVNPQSLTVRSADGFVGSYAVGPKTKVRVAEKRAAISDVATGDQVRVVAVKDGQTATARRVADRRR